jgi:two-component system, LytTR family, response regulator
MNLTASPTTSSTLPWKSRIPSPVKHEHLSPLSAVIIENEAGSRDVLMKLLQFNHPNVEVCGAAMDVASGVEVVRRERPDVIFLDINLGDHQEGFEILQALGSQVPYVIVTTAHKDHAVRAFKFSAVDFLVKPIDPAELGAALEKARSQVDTDRRMGHLEKLLYKVDGSGRMRVPNRNGFDLITIKDIIYCQSAKNLSSLFMSGGKEHVIARSIGQLEEDLADGFLRVHKTHLINLAHIQSYIRGEGGQVVMSDTKHIAVSREKKHALMEALGLV